MLSQLALQLGGSAFRVCEGGWACQKLAGKREDEEREAVAAGSRGGNGTHTSNVDGFMHPPSWALVRRYHSAWDAMYQDHCAGVGGW